MEKLPCQTCEMKSSCARDKRCLRPRTLAYWVQEVREAAAAMKAAAQRLNAAVTGMNAALQREKGAP